MLQSTLHWTLTSDNYPYIETLLKFNPNKSMLKKIFCTS